MYFRNYGFQKRWLDKWLKSPVSENFSSDNMANGLKHILISTAALLEYLLITVKVIELEIVSLSDIKNR